MRRVTDTFDLVVHHRDDPDVLRAARLRQNQPPELSSVRFSAAPNVHDAGHPTGSLVQEIDWRPVIENVEHEGPPW
jgi:hypothetical protein